MSSRGPATPAAASSAGAGGTGGVHSPPPITRTTGRVMRGGVAAGAGGVGATPIASTATASGRLQASPAAVISATPVVAVTKTAEQLDRAKLDARLSALLGNPFAVNAAGGGPMATFAELDELQGEAAHQQRLNDLRQLEAALEVDDWSYS